MQKTKQKTNVQSKVRRGHDGDDQIKSKNIAPTPFTSTCEGTCMKRSNSEYWSPLHTLDV